MQAQTPTQYPTSTLTSSGTEKPPSNQAGYNRVAGIILLVLQVLFMFIYGFLGQIRNKTIQELVINAIYGSYFIFTSVFVVLGFGMVFAYFKNNIATGFFTSLFIVSFTMILSPLLQNFWNNTFVSGF